MIKLKNRNCDYNLKEIYALKIKTYCENFLWLWNILKQLGSIPDRYFYNLINISLKILISKGFFLYLNDKLNQLPKDIISGSRLNFKIQTGKILDFLINLSESKMIGLSKYYT